MGASVSALMVAERLASIGLAGCGERSPCAEAAASAWGRVPFVQWPISFVGLAYFLGVLALAFNHRTRPILRHALRAGAAVSVFYLVVLIGNRLLCAYCVGVHVANLAAWLLCERSPEVAHTPRVRPKSCAPAALLSLLTLASLGMIDRVVVAERTRRASRELERSVRRINEASPGTDGASDSFSGRYRCGPTDAAIQVVIFTDYQCPDCSLVHRQIESLLAERNDIAVSVKHFPFCRECNRHIPKDLHANACWAARAAEAAGLIGGTEAFWSMHRWLFARAGSFTDAEIRSHLADLSLPIEAFLETMTSERTLSSVRSDTDEALSLGLTSTPMIFVNGVELVGWRTPDAIGRAVRSLNTSKLDHAASRHSRPPDAITKFLNEWASQAAAVIPSPALERSIGPGDARVRILIFGDYQEPNCAEADAVARGLVAKRSDTRYEFRDFPLDSSCNPSVPSRAHPLACRLAATAQAVRAIDGPSAFWTVHQWLFGQQATLREETLETDLAGLGVTPAALAAANSTDVAASVVRDRDVAVTLGVTGVPLVFVNERLVNRWNYGELPLLEAIVAHAADHPP